MAAAELKAGADKLASAGTGSLIENGKMVDGQSYWIKTHSNKIAQAVFKSGKFEVTEEVESLGADPEQVTTLFDLRDVEAVGIPSQPLRQKWTHQQ